MSLADLLLAGPSIQFHNLHPTRIVEICPGRVIERDVPVLTDSHDAEVSGMFTQELLVVLTGGFEIGRVARHRVKSLRFHLIEQMPPQEERKTGTVPCRQIHVFVHVEDVDGLPGHIRPRPDGVQKTQLRVARCQDDIRLAALGYSCFQHRGGFLSRGQPQAGIRSENTDRQLLEFLVIEHFLRHRIVLL